MQLLARNGAPEGFAQPLAVTSKSPSPRKKGLRQGGKIMFGAVAFLPLFIALSAAARHGGPMFIPVFAFCVGLMRMIYARIFEDAAPEPQVVLQPIIHPVPVPPQPVSFLQSEYQHPTPPSPQTNVPTTGNLVQPPSVVEPTTNLLNRQ